MKKKEYINQLLTLRSVIDSKIDTEIKNALFDKGNSNQINKELQCIVDTYAVLDPNYYRGDDVRRD